MTQWREERDRAVAAHAEALARKRAKEAAQAGALIAAFVADALATALPLSDLHCVSYDGKARYRTGLRGWHLNQARTVAVDAAANFYVLTVPRSFTARFLGATPQPSDPPLIVGEGSRDGESMPLAELLTRRLGSR